MTDLRIGIIGLGVRSEALGPLLHRPGEGSRVVAIADIGAFQRERASVRLPEAKLFSDHRHLLGETLDAVFVLSSDWTHAAIATDALRAGVPVFVEKPIATTTEDADDLLRVQRDTDGLLYVGHNMRVMPWIRQMRSIIDAGDIGSVQSVWCRHFVGSGGDYYFKDWHAERAYVNSLLLQKGAHDLDIIHWFAGAPSRAVSAFARLAVYDRAASAYDREDQLMTDWFDAGNWPPRSLTGVNPRTDVEDLYAVNLQLENGVIASYQECHFTPDHWRNFTVIGDEGRVENFGNGGATTIRVWNQRSKYREHGDAEYVIDPASSTGGNGGGDPRIVEDFFAVVRGEREPAVHPLDAREAVAAGDAATRSARSGGALVSVERFDPRERRLEDGAEPILNGPRE